MRILTFLHSFEPGGVERDALRLNAEWSRLGTDVQVVLGRREGNLEAEAPPLPYTVLQTGTFSTAAFETLWMIAKLPGAIRALKPDIIFCAGNTYTIVAVMLRFILGAACPPIILRISNDLERRDLPWIMRKPCHWWLRIQAPFFARIVAMAAPLKGEILRRMDADGHRTSVIDNASIRLADIERIAAAHDKAKRGTNGRHFVSIGRLVPQKNWPLLIRAFAEMRQPADILTIAGEGGERARLERLIAQLDLGEAVLLPGHVFPVDSLLANAQLFVLPSNYEGLPAVIIEALAAGLPIVATDSSDAMPMLVEEAGVLVPRNNPEALATAMSSQREEPENRARLRALACRFTVERAAPQWLHLFASAAGDARAFTA